MQASGEAAEELLPAEFTSAAIRAILDQRTASGDAAVAGSYELQVEWDAPGGAGRRIWLPRALLMSDGVTAGMVHEFEDNLVRRALSVRASHTCLCISRMPGRIARSWSKARNLPRKQRRSSTRWCTRTCSSARPAPAKIRVSECVTSLTLLSR